MTSEVPITEIFTGEDPINVGERSKESERADEHLDHGMRSLMDDLGITMEVLLGSSIFVYPSITHWMTVDW